MFMRGLRSRVTGHEQTTSTTAINNRLLANRDDETGPSQQANMQDAQNCGTVTLGMLAVQLQARDKELQELRSEHHALLQSYKQQNSEINSLAERNTNGEKEFMALRGSVNELQYELQACKDDLFRLQPVVQTPDTEIMRQYDTVCQQVSNWVDEEISQLEQKRDKDGGRNMPFILGGAHLEAMELLRRVPEAGEYMVVSVIHAYLQDKLLGEHVYSFGLSEDLIRTLKRIEHGMAKLEPTRDMKTIENWRSETLKAIAEHPSAIKERTRVLQDVATNLFDSLGPFFPIHQMGNASLVRLYEQVCVPAAKLASDIQLSSSRYEFNPRMPKFPILRYKVAVMDNLKHVTAIDVSTRKTLKPDSPVVAKKDGKIGQPLLLLEPSLSRVDIGASKRLLRKPVYLIELADALKKRDRGSIG